MVVGCELGSLDEQSLLIWAAFGCSRHSSTYLDGLRCWRCIALDAQDTVLFSMLSSVAPRDCVCKGRDRDWAASAWPGYTQYVSVDRDMNGLLAWFPWLPHKSGSSLFCGFSTDGEVPNRFEPCSIALTARTVQSQYARDPGKR